MGPREVAGGPDSGQHPEGGGQGSPQMSVMLALLMFCPAPQLMVMPAFPEPVTTETRPPVAQAQPAPVVRPRATASPVLREPKKGTSVARGWATWYQRAPGGAAAGPVVRRALGGGNRWRGKYVSVCSVSNGPRCIRVQLDDWCACGERGGSPTLLDLSKSDFARLAIPGRGVIKVTVSK